MPRAPLHWLCIPFVLVAAFAQRPGTSIRMAPTSWTAQEAYALSVLRAWSHQCELQITNGRSPRAAQCEPGELWFCGYEVRFAQSRTATGAMTGVIWPREPTLPHWTLFARPTNASQRTFYFRPGAALQWATGIPAEMQAPFAAATWNGELPLATGSRTVVVTDDDGAALVGAVVRFTAASGLPVTELLPPGVPLAGTAPAGFVTVGADGSGSVAGIDVPGLVVRVSLGGASLSVRAADVRAEGGTVRITVARAAQNSASLERNEGTALAFLRNLLSAQRQCQAAAVIDADGDGSGEFGFLAELAGAAATRNDGAGGVGPNSIQPPVLAASCGNLQNARFLRAGYCVVVFLPDRSGAWVGERADGDGARGIAIDPDRAERSWCALAWPMKAGWTGRRVFCLGADGVVHEFANAARTFSGAAAPRPWTSEQPPSGWTSVPK